MIKQDVLFQPTHPCGVRHEDFPLFYVVFFVSTHAPLRGATSILESLGVDTDVSTHAPLRGATHKCWGGWRWPKCCFNPRTPAGCDDTLVRAHLLSCGFNPRTPAGCDQRIKPNKAQYAGFNPRTPAGCDGSP